MTPKEKAIDLVHVQFAKIIGGDFTLNYLSYKAAALLLVEEVDEALHNGPYGSPENEIGSFNYWEQVKTEIEKLP